MKDIALAGFMLTLEEWQALDAVSRAQLMAAASEARRDDPWVVAALSGILESGPSQGPIDGEA
jgi:hypothetical protein